MAAALCAPPPCGAPVAFARSPYLDGAVTDLPSTPMTTILLGTLPGSEPLRGSGGVFRHPASPPPQPASPTQGHPLRRPHERPFLSVIPDCNPPFSGTQPRHPHPSGDLSPTTASLPRKVTEAHARLALNTWSNFNDSVKGIRQV